MQWWAAGSSKGINTDREKAWQTTEDDVEAESKEGRKVARQKRRKLPKKQVNKDGRKKM